MKALFKLLMGAAVVLVLLLVVGMLLPERTQIERTITVQASPEKIYPYIANYRLFNQWSPWMRMDPDIEVKFEGPEQGQGAIMHWRSDKSEVGQGSQKIIEANESQSIRTVLAFGGMGKAYSSFQLQAQQSGTRISWGFDMRYGYNFPGRLIGLLMKGELVETYDEGLLNLKELVEQ